MFNDQMHSIQLLKRAKDLFPRLTVIEFSFCHQTDQKPFKQRNNKEQA